MGGSSKTAAETDTSSTNVGKLVGRRKFEEEKDSVSVPPFSPPGLIERRPQDDPLQEDENFFEDPLGDPVRENYGRDATVHL